MLKNKSNLYLTGGLIGLFGCSVALAQQTAQPQSEPQPLEEPGLELETLIVTSEKVQRSIQDTITSVSVINSEDIEALNAVDIEDILSRVGNAGFVTVGSGRNEQFTLRGVSSQGVTPGTSTPVSTIYLDGAVVPNQAAGATVSNLFDVTQVEVLRGAQSTVQGRNSLIGALSLTTETPDLNEWSGKARATYGNYGSYEASAAFGGPIVADELGVRFVAQRTASDGYVTRMDGSNGDEEESTLFRTKVLWQPESMPGFSMNLSATISDEEDGSVLVSDENPEAQLQVTDIPQDTSRELALFSMELDIPLTKNWNLVSLTTYSELEERSFSDFDGLPAQGFPVSPFRLDERDITDALQEFRLEYNADGNLSGFVGVLWADRDSNTDTQVSQTFGVPPIDLRLLGLNSVYQGVLGINAPSGVPNNLRDPLIFGSTLPIQSDFVFNPAFETLALFAEFDYEFSDRWTLTTGFRYEEEEATYAGSQLNTLVDASDRLAVGGGNPALPGAIATGLANAGVPQNVAQAASGPIASFYPAFANGALGAAFGNPDVLELVDLEDSGDFSVFMPKLAITYDFSDDVSLSLSGQKAYRPGGLGINPVQTFVYSVDQEESINYELALRSVWLDNRLSINANVFYIDWEDQQLEVALTPTPQDTVVLNVGESELSGMEVEIRAQATETIELFASLGFLSTEVTLDSRQNPVGALLTGDEFAFAPDTTATIGMFYNSPTGYSASVDVNYQSESQPLLPNETGLFGRLNDDRTLVNLRLGYDGDNYSIFLFGANILDEVYFANAEAAGGGAVIGAPRTYGIGASYEW